MPFAVACSVADTFADPHVQARGAIVPTGYPVAGAVRMQRVYPRFSRTPGAIRSGAPGLGEHNAEVQGGLLGLVDAVVEVLPPGACPACGGAVDTERVDVKYQADLPPVQPHVTAFHLHVGRCRHCGRRVHGRDRRQTPTATGAAASQVGPRALAWAAWLHTALGVPFA